MKISASLKSNYNHHDIVVKTDETSKEMQILPQPTGFGLSVSGAELLLGSLGTSFCNDFYREAARQNMSVSGVEVIFNGEFGREGKPGTNFNYQAHVIAEASASEIEGLITYTDQIAAIHNTLRKGVPITLTN